MKNITILAIALFLSSCDNSQLSAPEMTPNNKGAITYFKDQRTGACFAAINSNTYMNSKVTSIACVPCEFYEKYMQR